MFLRLVKLIISIVSGTTMSFITLFLQNIVLVFKLEREVGIEPTLFQLGRLAHHHLCVTRVSEGFWLGAETKGKLHFLNVDRDRIELPARAASRHRSTPELPIREKHLLSVNYT